MTDLQSALADGVEVPPPRTLLPVEVFGIVTLPSTGERIACVRLGSGTTTAFVPAADLITER